VLQGRLTLGGHVKTRLNRNFRRFSRSPTFTQSSLRQGLAAKIARRAGGEVHIRFGYKPGSGPIPAGLYSNGIFHRQEILRLPVIYFLQGRVQVVGIYRSGGGTCYQQNFRRRR